jgi:hypothetical protein
MSALIAIGRTCAGAPEHAIRHWVVDSERRLHFRNTGAGSIRPELSFALTLPIPGVAPPITCDAARLIVLLNDGSGWRLDVRRHQWTPLTKECYMAQSKSSSPAIVAAGSSCGYLWVVDRDRRAWTWSPTGRGAVGEARVPGEARVAAVDVALKTVLLEDGERYAWLASGWTRLQSLLGPAEAATMRVVVVSGFCAGPPHGDVYPGQVIELPEAEARRLMAVGRAGPVPLDDAPGV